ncbi:MAG: methylmalonyl-CoA mutase family protein [Actinomycetota bacterium]|nr:methylmalonyl-CoA mutase family protein [Actinomycetota bacterium]
MNNDDLYRPTGPVRFITAASLFDGHDASINIMRRLLMAQGAEVIHLGHNRSVEEIVEAAIEEDAHGIALSSYQGGHVEYFKFLVDRLREEKADIKVFGGGGGVIVPREIDELERYGVAKIFSPEDGQRFGLVKMINMIIQEADHPMATITPDALHAISFQEKGAIARAITNIEDGTFTEDSVEELESKIANQPQGVVLGITGTGGAGKSSLTDELIRRFRIDHGDKISIAVLAIDPTRRRGGGALLGDRIRMNAIDAPNIYFRSLATRGAASEIPEYTKTVLKVLKAAAFDVIIVETPGIGQGDNAITSVSDLSLYVMTPEFGAASQLEKIDMIDYADVIAINKFDRRGGEDALRLVARQWVREHFKPGLSPSDAPVFGTIASRFNDDGMTALYGHIASLIKERREDLSGGLLQRKHIRHSTSERQIIPSDRLRYLLDVSSAIRRYHAKTNENAKLIASLDALIKTTEIEPTTAAILEPRISDLTKKITEDELSLISKYESVKASILAKFHDEEYNRVSLSGNEIPSISFPHYVAKGDIYSFIRRENLPGHFPFTAGVFPFRRRNEDPTRMFAGEGDPSRTNRRFHLLAQGQPATRLSTAFDSVTLYGRDPDLRPDIYGKIGTSGVSIATLDDMKVLYSGFDLCDPKTSVSMTINGPAPTILAMFFNTAIDQRLERFEIDNGRRPSDEEINSITSEVLSTVRGTVQADILKEDQGQNTCIFSTEFSLKVMGDIQEYFVEKDVRNFYSVSISGYHIAEAGANPITQLAFTLSNAFTYVEAYLARGMKIDDFAPNLSFFFSNGMDPEYNVIGRVARRIWAIAIREIYGGNERSQRLKYHIQTSGRSLHAQEISFNDIRTTLQALCAIYDNANSLHTNAYDEAITTPTDESVRRALAIQMIINREWGLTMNENSLQGSFIIEELTDLVEEAVLKELERINERGGVLGAMEMGYQRSKIQDDSMYYEERKHSGELPIIGVNTFRSETNNENVIQEVKLARATEDEKMSQIDRVNAFKVRHRGEAELALESLRQVALADGNIFAELMKATRVASLGQITDALFEIGGVYRRNV